MSLVDYLPRCVTHTAVTHLGGPSWETLSSCSPRYKAIHSRECSASEYTTPYLGTIDINESMNILSHASVSTPYSI